MPRYSPTNNARLQLAAVATTVPCIFCSILRRLDPLDTLYYGAPQAHLGDFLLLPLLLSPPSRSYEFLYKQAVDTADNFLGMSGKDPSSSSCEDLVVRVELPEAHSAAGEVREGRPTETLVLAIPAVSSLSVIEYALYSLRSCIPSPWVFVSRPHGARALT